MHEAFWNGLLDVRWEDAPLGPEATRLVLRLRECGYAERTCRDYGHAVIHLGGVLRLFLTSRPCQALIQGYSRFLRRDRGLAETTVVNYRRYLGDFLASRGDAVSPAELVALTAEDLLVSSRRRGARLGRTAWNHLATRSEFREAGRSRT